MPEKIGTVTEFIENPKKNNEVFGLKLDNAMKADEFLYSFPDYRGEPFQDSEVKRGDRVRLEYTDTEKEGKTKRYISVLEIVDGAAPSEPSGDVVDRDRLIVRQTCIKSAGMALQHGMGNPEEKAGAITYLAGVLEEWVMR